MGLLYLNLIKLFNYLTRYAILYLGDEKMASNYKFSSEEIAAIKAARRETKDKRADARLKALELRAEGLELSEVAQAAGFHAAYVGGVKSYAQNQFWYLAEIYYRGRLNRPLVTVQRAGRKGSRAAVRRSSCP